MVKLAKILTGATLVLLAFLAIALFGVRLRVSVVEFSAQPAREHIELSEELIRTAARDDMDSDLFKRPTRTGIDRYQLITIKLRARNVGILPAEWVQLRIAPDPGDIALFSGGEVDIPGLFRTREITGTLLAETEAGTALRRLSLEYYVFGRKLEVAVPIDYGDAS